MLAATALGVREGQSLSKPDSDVSEDEPGSSMGKGRMGIHGYAYQDNAITQVT